MMIFTCKSDFLYPFGALFGIFISTSLCQFKDCLQHSKWHAGSHSLLVDPSEDLWINVERLGQLGHL